MITPNMRIILIKTQQKRAKKTNFSAVPSLVSRLGGILGRGAPPPFEKRF